MEVGAGKGRLRRMKVEGGRERKREVEGGCGVEVLLAELYRANFILNTFLERGPVKLSFRPWSSLDPHYRIITGSEDLWLYSTT